MAEIDTRTDDKVGRMSSASIAILRYNLFDMGVIVHRTLTNALNVASAALYLDDGSGTHPLCGGSHGAAAR